MAFDPTVDFYELLQLSPAAEPATVLAVYRVLSAKYDPANKSTGDAQRYHLIKKAYETLSNKDKRLAYDKQRRTVAPANGATAPSDESLAPAQNGTAATAASATEAPALPAAPTSQVDRKLEARKRHIILALLYDKIIVSPTQPGLNMRQIEEMLRIPKEQLEFAIWFLNESGSIKSLDNGRFMITFQGVAVCEKGEEELKAASQNGGSSSASSS